MGKIWQIIKFEYIRRVSEKQFLFALLSLPLVVVITVIVVFAISVFTINTDPIGYIDRSGFLTDAAPNEFKGNIFDPAIDFIPYSDLTRAQDDLESGLIQAYYVIPQTFPEVRDVELFFIKIPMAEAQNQFMQWVRQNLDTFKAFDPLVLERLEEGSLFTMTTLDGSREMQQDQWFLLILPIIAGITFIIVVLTSGGYLLQAVVEEKENRTMEIVITSVTPTQLMVGKTIGNISVGLTQLAVWLIFSWIGLSIAGRFWPALNNISIPGEMFLVMAFLFLPSFIIIAAIMSTIGAIVTEMREAQQISGVFSLFVTIPLYVITPMMMNPNGTLALVLSFFPPTAPIAVMLRMALTTVPTWQIVVNVLALVIFAILSMWLAGHAFRLGMLQYGKRLSLKELFRKQEAA